MANLIMTESGYIAFQSQFLMMLDWDVKTLAPTFTHGHCTGNDREEIVSRLRKRCKNRPHELWAIYFTHSGLHAFRLDKRIHVLSNAAWEAATSLKCDPLYYKYALKRKVWRGRVQPKQGRKLDRIHFKYFIGTGTCHPVNLVELELHHSALVEYGMTYKNLPTPKEVLERSLAA